MIRANTQTRSAEDNACCAQLGGTVVPDPSDPTGNSDSCVNANLGGTLNTIWNGEACYYLSEYGQAPGQDSNGNGGGFLEGLSNFDFGIVSNAYCNLAPLFNNGIAPAGCLPNVQGQNGSPGDATESNTKKIVLGVVLVLAVASISYLVIRKLRK